MEQNYAREISYSDITDLMHTHHSIFDRKALNKAHEYAREKHTGVSRKTGEDYIMHPRRVAKFLAGLGCESDVVIAALLHDVVEDNDTVTLDDIRLQFGDEVAHMVDGVTKIDKNLEQFKGYTREEIHNLTDAKFLAMISDIRVLYIKLSDRRDNLYTYEGLSETKRIEKTTHTREILIPLALKIGAEKIADELEDLCFKIENEYEYVEIAKAFEEYKEENLVGFNTTYWLLKDSVTDVAREHRLIAPSSFMKFVHHLRVDKRSYISIHRQLTYEADNIQNDFSDLIQKNHIAWYDFTLVLHDDIEDNPAFNNPSEVFFKIYEECLISQGIYIIKTSYTTRKDFAYILLSDNLGNLFRLFIKTYTEYMHYKLGNIIDTYSALSFQSISNVAPRETLNEKIKIFKRNGAASWIDKGATVLDLAFAIHGDIGLHFSHALINNSKEYFPAYHVLNVGDRVEIVTSESETAEIRWFKYLKTADALQHLYHYYSKPDNLKKAMEKAEIARNSIT